jgi:nucleotide-binding universal stress UspA family protein
MPTFASILCAVDGSRASEAAVRRAVALAAPDAGLAFLAVVWREGAGPTERAALSVARAGEALDDAVGIAAASNVPCERVLEHAPDTVAAILRRAAGHALLVLGAPPSTRAGGILTGSVATAIVHQARGPVLLVRDTGNAETFPRRIVVASDGSRESQRAVRAAADIASARQADVTLVSVDGSETTPQIRDQVSFLRERLGREPHVATLGGHPHDAVAALADEIGADLLVVGSRGLHGARALASTSERLAHEASMSVLIARPARRLVVHPELAATARSTALRLREQAIEGRFTRGRVT